jgi:hypothetical protein
MCGEGVVGGGKKDVMHLQNVGEYIFLQGGFALSF